MSSAQMRALISYEFFLFKSSHLVQINQSVKMNKKLLVTISVTLIYALLMGMFYYFTQTSYGCRYLTPCVHFCSGDTEKYTDKYLIDHFKESKSAKEYLEDGLALKVIRGTPSCGKMKYQAPNDNTSRPPYEFSYYGEVIINKEKFNVKRYCIEKDDDVYDGWRLMTCYQDYYVQKGFHALAIFISISLFGFTLFVYAYFKELQDFYGKTIIALIGSNILADLSIPMFRYISARNYGTNDIAFLLLSILIMCLLMTLLWITVMIVHLFITFWNFKNNTKSSFEFSTYSIFVFSFGLFSTFVFIDNYLSFTRSVDYLSFIYVVMFLTDIVLMIITGIKIFITSRHLEHSEQARFDNERNWFWIVLKLSLIILTTWIFEAYIWGKKFDILIDTTGDLLHLLTASTVTAILVGREKARILLFQKYRGVSELGSDSA
ncbi:uncharacterized protein [Chironomus tepperi]|uniref:uncharacterized protein n=1 Tax=Chironomus tepperi TaxID=113505 RepID=UPI00391F5ADB